MKRRYTSRPAPAMSAIGAVVGIIILVVGIGAMSQAREFHPFFLLWIAVGVFVVGYHLVNALSGRAPATTIIESEDEPVEAKSVGDRLRELDELKQQRLVSDEEYEAKRKEILKDVCRGPMCCSEPGMASWLAIVASRVPGR